MPPPPLEKILGAPLIVNLLRSSCSTTSRHILTTCHLLCFNTLALPTAVVSLCHCGDGRTLLRSAIIIRWPAVWLSGRLRRVDLGGGGVSRRRPFTLTCVRD